MRTQLRHLVAAALYPTKAYSLPAVCERYGLDPGGSDEAFSSKTRYVTRRLEKLSDEKVFGVAKSVVQDFPDDKLLLAIELLEKDGHLITDLTRHHLAETLDEFSLAGKRDLLEMLRKHFPPIDHEASHNAPFATLADDIQQHAILNDDWQNAEILERVGFLTCSQAKLFQFLEDVLHPIRRDQEERERIVAKINPIIRRDGYFLVQIGRVSGQSIVGNLAGLRNRLGDSHGQGKSHVKPQGRHAELAVNLAGSMAMFLVSTWNSCHSKA